MEARRRRNEKKPSRAFSCLGEIIFYGYLIMPAFLRVT